MDVRQAQTVVSTTLFPFDLSRARDSGKISCVVVSPFCLQSCLRPLAGLYLQQQQPSPFLLS